MLRANHQNILTISEISSYENIDTEGWCSGVFMDTNQILCSNTAQKIDFSVYFFSKS